jgi:rSAM/selenodomain-associated transferase 1
MDYEFASKSLLVLFVRNPVRGQVKTRLAATVGADKALEVYHLLLQRTYEVTHGLDMDKVVYFSETRGLPEGWENHHYQQQVQQGADLGERMARAISAGFKSGYQRVGIIGSDCYELTAEILETAYGLLAEKDLVIGPATDGGYYFLGMTRFVRDLFRDKDWSTASVLAQTLADAERLHLHIALLPVLTDVDEEKDLVTIPGLSAGTTRG